MEGYKLILLPGYWRASLYTDSIYSCIIPEVCLGGLESECLVGHQGVMCNACKEDHFKVNQLQCGLQKAGDISGEELCSTRGFEGKCGGLN